MIEKKYIKRELLITQLVAYYVRKTYLANNSANELEWFLAFIPDEDREAVTADINSYMQRLESISTEELEELNRKEEKYFYLDDHVDFIHHKSANADFKYWGKMTAWNLEQSVALLLGKNPNIISWDNIGRYSSSYFVKTYYRLRELIRNAEKAGALYNNIEPYKFLEWCESKDIEIPGELKLYCIKYTSNEVPTYLNDQHPCYSPKLAAAFKAHQYLCQNFDKIKQKSIKKFIEEYLTNNAATLNLVKDGKVNRSAVEEIAKIVNCKPEGGAPKTGLSKS